MRLSVRRPRPGTLNWSAFRDQGVFLFRRVGDRGEAWIGAGVRSFHRESEPKATGAFQRIKEFVRGSGDWVFAMLGYDLKNATEALTTRLAGVVDLPLAYLFVPRFVVKLSDDEASLMVHDEDRGDGEAWLDRLLDAPQLLPSAKLGGWEMHTSKAAYLDRARRLMRHIQRGDIYEVNYCVERTAQADGWDPYAGFGRLLARSDAPHAAFFRSEDRFALCASPERFLRFERGNVLAQPMKGTRPRSHVPAQDRMLAEELSMNGKERSENIMAVDVVRNDLSRVAASRSVRVEELCSVKSYPTVHQMVSTVSAELKTDLHPVDAIRAAWPMASMTGAPKVSAMRLIDGMEDQRRGLFSGSLGFFAPDGTADLNVVIRTILFDAVTGRASLTTGSALTAACDPEQEWEECELKARSVLNAIEDAG